MAVLKAVHIVKVGGDDIAPGTVAEFADDSVEFLRSVGAVTDPSDAELETYAKAHPAPEAKAKAAPKAPVETIV